MLEYKYFKAARLCPGGPLVRCIVGRDGLVPPLLSLRFCVLTYAFSWLFSWVWLSVCHRFLPNCVGVAVYKLQSVYGAYTYAENLVSDFSVFYAKDLLSVE